MDTDALIAHSRARFDHAAARRVLREKYEAKMIFGYNGGMFRATPEMITFLSLYENQTIVVQDLYGTPVKVDADEIKESMKARLQEQMNAWLQEYQEIEQRR